MDFRENVFTERFVKNWSRLPKEVVGSPSLEVFENRKMSHLGAWLSGGFGSVGVNSWTW